MTQPRENSGHGAEVKSMDEKERTEKANEVYCKACEESGLKVASWENFAAWQEYVDGKIDDTQLVERVRQEMEQFAGRFGKYLVVANEDPVPVKKEQEKRDRARQANKTYKKVCEEAGIDVCFFSNFSTWSEYVQGGMSDADFYDQAKVEVRKMSTESKE
jgi:glucose-6-phosphate 1-dehydrogenase